MESVLNFLQTIWEFFANNILTQPAYFIGLLVVIGYLLLRRPWYEVLAGFVKATVGYLILIVGSGGLVGNFRPILVGLKDRLTLDAMVIDPYFGQMQLLQASRKVFGRAFSSVMVLLLIAFIFNIFISCI